ncbi:MAG: twin-arginine translocase subunit TatC [Elusimicrobia bacterium]|nr:twin-arginine translocase subunit TatC [Elusimicrobiota bacterium]
MAVLLEHEGRGSESPSFSFEDTPKSLVAHLDELRTCIIRALLGLLAGTLAAYALFPRILELLMRPPIEKLVFTSPIEPFFAQCKVSIALGFGAAFPWILYQAWRFVGPGLTPKERRVLLKLIPASYALLLGGAAIGLFGAVPMGLKFLMSYSTERLQPYITLSSYLSYITYMTLGLGILFQVPLALFALCAVGALSPDTLSRYRRHVILGILVVAAVITPSADIYGQLIVAVPTYVLFEAALIAARISLRSKSA